MNPPFAICALVVTVVVGLSFGCADRTGLEPLPEIDRVEIGELKRVAHSGQITDSASLIRARALANDLRSGTWSSLHVVHPACGSVLLTYYAGTKVVGYLALEGGFFYTHGPGGQHSRAANQEKTAEFMALLPTGFERRRCEARA